MHQMGFNPYPEWWPPLEGKTRTPEYFARYPFVLVTGRTLDEKTQGGNDCVLINSHDAQTIGLTEGSEVWVESKINKVKKKEKNKGGYGSRSGVDTVGTESFAG